MARGLSSAFKTELATKNINPVLLLNVNFSTPIYYTNAPFDIAYDGNTYTKQGYLLGVTNVSETSSITQGTLSFTFSGVDQAYISVVLNENVIHRQIKLYVGLLDSSNALISDPFLLFDGRIKDFTITDTDTDSKIVFGVASHWADFDRAVGRKTTNTSQQKHYLNDLGMNFAGVTTRDIIWGKAGKR